MADNATITLAGLSAAGAALEQFQRLPVSMQAGILGRIADNIQQWIPVSERFPPDGVCVLGWETIRETFIVVQRKDGSWFYSLGRLADWRVRHWMPLPEPPK
jgi:hypothetical protein